MLKNTPKQTAEDIIYESILGRWQNGLFWEQFLVDNPEASEREEQLVREQIDKICNRITKSYCKRYNNRRQ